MLLIKTYIAPSVIEGIGLFSGENIAKGTAIWTFFDGVDRIYSEDEIANFPPSVRQYLKRYAYQESQLKWILDGDNGRFTNHSTSPNTAENADSTTTFALRDIEKGEEITCNYFEFDLSAAKKLSPK